MLCDRGRSRDVPCPFVHCYGSAIDDTLCIYLSSSIFRSHRKHHALNIRGPGIALSSREKSREVIRVFSYVVSDQVGDWIGVAPATQRLSIVAAYSGQRLSTDHCHPDSQLLCL